MASDLTAERWPGRMWSVSHEGSCHTCILCVRSEAGEGGQSSSARRLRGDQCAVGNLSAGSWSRGFAHRVVAAGEEPIPLVVDGNVENAAGVDHDAAMRAVVVGSPDLDLAVVRAREEQRLTHVAEERAHPRLVALERGLAVPTIKVPHLDGVVIAAGVNERITPRDRADACMVAGKRVHAAQV